MEHNSERTPEVAHLLHGQRLFWIICNRTSFFYHLLRWGKKAIELASPPLRKTGTSNYWEKGCCTQHQILQSGSDVTDFHPCKSKNGPVPFGCSKKLFFYPWTVLRWVQPEHRINQLRTKKTRKRDVSPRPPVCIHAGKTAAHAVFYPVVVKTSGWKRSNEINKHGVHI